MASNLARLEEVSRQSQKGVRSHHNWKLRRRGRDAEDGEIAKPCGGRRLRESGDEQTSSFSFLRLPSLHHTAPLSFLLAIIRAANPIMLHRLDGPEIHGHTRRIKAHIWGVEH